MLLITPVRVYFDLLRCLSLPKMSLFTKTQLYWAALRMGISARLLNSLEKLRQIIRGLKTVNLHLLALILAQICFILGRSRVRNIIKWCLGRNPLTRLKVKFSWVWLDSRSINERDFGFMLRTYFRVQDNQFVHWFR